MLYLAWRRRDNISRRANVNGSLASVFARDGVYYFLVLSCECCCNYYVHQCRQEVLILGSIALAAANITVVYTAPVRTIACLLDLGMS